MYDCIDCHSTLRKKSNRISTDRRRMSEEGGIRMKIRQTKDASEIALLNRPVHDRHVERYPQYFKPYHQGAMTRFFEQKVDHPSYFFFLAKVERKPVGYLWLEHRTYEENVFKSAYTSLYVHQISLNEEERGKGYGRQMMEHVETVAQEIGADEIELDYWVENKEAKRFYERNGYRIRREFVYKTLREE
ncbi:GNAT family N-acetyltransferase [Halobacillus fulvus]|nr:GNAT family N-acetyltransferase [Halobacillus fulvus]